MNPLTADRWRHGTHHGDGRAQYSSGGTRMRRYGRLHTVYSFQNGLIAESSGQAGAMVKQEGQDNDRYS
jgi:hypothetical protein